jgi:hypothetical protein
MTHPVVWFEVLGHSGEGLRQYGKVFGWRFDADNRMKYGTVDTGDKARVVVRRRLAEHRTDERRRVDKGDTLAWR